MRDKNDSEPRIVEVYIRHFTLCFIFLWLLQLIDKSLIFIPLLNDRWKLW